MANTAAMKKVLSVAPTLLLIKIYFAFRHQSKNTRTPNLADQDHQPGFAEALRKAGAMGRAACMRGHRSV